MGFWDLPWVLFQVLVLARLCILCLFAEALMSIGKLRYALMQKIHALTSVLAAAALIVIVYFYVQG
jgi:hypothetical protein